MSSEITPPASNTQKPGWKTSEFWVTLGGALMMVLTMTLNLTPEQAAEGNAWIGKAAVSVVGLVGFVIGVWRYLHSRVEMKKSENDAATTIQTAAIHAAAANSYPQQDKAIGQAQPLRSFVGMVGEGLKSCEECCVRLDCPRKLEKQTEKHA